MKGFEECSWCNWRCLGILILGGACIWLAKPDPVYWSQFLYSINSNEFLRVLFASLAGAIVGGIMTQRAMREQVKAQAEKENDRIRRRLYGELNRILLVLKSSQRQLGFFDDGNNKIYEAATEPKFSFEFGTEWRSLLYELDKDLLLFEQRMKIESFINRFIYYVPSTLGENYISRSNSSTCKNNIQIPMVSLPRLFREVESFYLNEETEMKKKSLFPEVKSIADFVNIRKNIEKLEEFITQLKD